MVKMDNTAPMHVVQPIVHFPREGVRADYYTAGNTILCSLKPYDIKVKTVTTNAVDSTAVLLSVMIRQTVSGLEGQCHLSGSCRTAREVVALLGKL